MAGREAINESPRVTQGIGGAGQCLHVLGWAENTDLSSLVSKDGMSESGELPEYDNHPRKGLFETT